MIFCPFNWNPEVYIKYFCMFARQLDNKCTPEGHLFIWFTFLPGWSNFFGLPNICFLLGSVTVHISVSFSNFKKKKIVLSLFTYLKSYRRGDTFVFCSNCPTICSNLVHKTVGWTTCTQLLDPALYSDFP